jgi:hypothetical protein
MLYPAELRDRTPGLRRGLPQIAERRRNRRPAMLPKFAISAATRPLPRRSLHSPAVQALLPSVQCRHREDKDENLDRFGRICVFDDAGKRRVLRVRDSAADRRDSASDPRDNAASRPAIARHLDQFGGAGARCNQQADGLQGRLAELHRAGPK